MMVPSARVLRPDIQGLKAGDIQPQVRQLQFSLPPPLCSTQAPGQDSLHPGEGHLRSQAPIQMRISSGDTHIHTQE